MKKKTPHQKLMSAILRNNPYDAEKAIKDGANANYADERKETPLHKACKLGFAKVVRVLLKNGADLDAVNIHGKTPLRFAVDGLYYNERSPYLKGTLETIFELLSKGADPDSPDIELETPMGMACGWANLHADFSKDILERVSEDDRIVLESFLHVVLTSSDFCGMMNPS